MSCNPSIILEPATVATHACKPMAVSCDESMHAWAAYGCDESMHAWAALQVNSREEELLSLLRLAAVRLDASERRLVLTQQACNPM